MDATADDWESLEQILPYVERWLGPQTPEKIQKILSDLHDEGLIELMSLEGITPESIQTDIARCWFSMMPKGRQLWDADGAYYRNEIAERVD